MKTILNKYGFAVMSVSVVIGYFLFTGGVMNTAVVITPPNMTMISNGNTTVGAQFSSTRFEVWEQHAYDTKPGQQCDFGPPPHLVDVDDPIEPYPIPEVEYSTKLNSPGAVASDWTKITTESNISQRWGPFFFTVKTSFNAPGVYTVTVRARSKRNAGYSNYTERVFGVTVTGTAPLPPKRYTFNRLLAEYRDASGGTISATQVIFTDPANQYFELKGDDKIDMVFKWKPTAADIQAVPDLEANYDIRDLNKTYQVLNKAPSGTTPFWSYKIKYDETRVVEFEFIEDALNGNLYATKPAKAGNGTTIRLIFQFRK